MDTDTEEEIPIMVRGAGVPGAKGRDLSPRTRERLGVKGLDLRRPVRPVDREKMRPWLHNLLDSGSVFGLKWLHKDQGTFHVSWRHASRLGWKLETDGDVFEKWARHTGIYKDGDDPEPKRWKANFRCALHSLPDVRELTDPMERRGHNANRTYRFLQPHEVAAFAKRRSNPAPPTEAADQGVEVVDEPTTTVVISEDSSSLHNDCDNQNMDEDAQYREIYVLPQSDHDYATRMGRQEGEESVTKVLSEHGSGFVLIKTKRVAPSLPTTLIPALDIPLERPLERAAAPGPLKRPLERAAPGPMKRPLERAPPGPPVVSGGKVSKTSVPGRDRLRQRVRAQQAGRAVTVTGGHGAHADGHNARCRLTAPRGPRQGAGRGQGSPSAPLGFEALLEAANRARMDTLTGPPLSTPPTTTTTTTPPQHQASDCCAAPSEPVPQPALAPPLPPSLVLSLLHSLLGPNAVSALTDPAAHSPSPLTLDLLQGQSADPAAHSPSPLTLDLLQGRSADPAAHSPSPLTLDLLQGQSADPAISMKVSSKSPTLHCGSKPAGTGGKAAGRGDGDRGPSCSSNDTVHRSQSATSGFQSESPDSSVTTVKVECVSPMTTDDDDEERGEQWEVTDIHPVTSLKVDPDDFHMQSPSSADSVWGEGSQCDSAVGSHTSPALSAPSSSPSSHACGAGVGAGVGGVKMGPVFVVNPSIVVSVSQDDVPGITLSQLQDLLSLCLGNTPTPVQPHTHSTQSTAQSTQSTAQSTQSTAQSTAQSTIQSTAQSTHVPEANLPTHPPAVPGAESRPLSAVCATDKGGELSAVCATRCATVKGGELSGELSAVCATDIGGELLGRREAVVQLADSSVSDWDLSALHQGHTDPPANMAHYDPPANMADSSTVTSSGSEDVP